MRALIERWAGPALLLFALALGVGYCAERDARIRADALGEARLEAHRAVIEAWRGDRSALLGRLADRSAEVERLLLVQAGHEAAARRARLERDSIDRPLARLLPDTGEVRRSVDAFREACFREVSALRSALGACSAATDSLRLSVADLEAGLARSDSLLADATEGWEDAERRASPGLFRRFLQAQPFALAESLLAVILTR